jgi:predicted DNA-binding transcriptional regulator AlpA
MKKDAAAEFVSTELAQAQDDALVDKRALARMLGVCPRTIQYMVARRELPPGVEMGNRRVWFAGMVRRFLKDRAERAAERREEEWRDFAGLRAAPRRARRDL